MNCVSVRTGCRFLWVLVAGFGLALPAPLLAQAVAGSGTAAAEGVSIDSTSAPAATATLVRGRPLAEALPGKAPSFDSRWREEAAPMRSDHTHPFRGTLATVGGLVAGFGIGLALEEPAAGMLTGAGVGMMLTAVLRAFGDW